VVGVTEPASTTSFRNEIVAWGPRGHIVGVFEKVHRVPFGEYVPLRSLFSHFANLSGVPVDAVPGHGTGLMRTPAGPLGLLVSFEVFYAGRSHESVRAGAQLLAVPTNTSSYSTSQVPTQEVAAAIVQAVETGRDLVQAAAAAARRRGGGRRLGPATALFVIAGVDVDAGHPGRHVHGVVGRVVLEGEPQVEAIRPEILHHRLLELGDLGIVPPRAHHEQVPAQPVPLQPGQRLFLDPVGSPGEEDDGERLVEQLQQAGDLLNHRVVPAGLEEGSPVPPPAVQEVLTAGGIGQDPVDVEDDGRPSRVRRRTFGGVPSPIDPVGFWPGLGHGE